MVLMSWGANSYGQLGLGHQVDQLLPCDCRWTESSVERLYGGGGHTVLLIGEGQVLGCGWNNKGQLGVQDTRDRSRFVQVPYFKQKRVVKVSCGWDFTLLLTDDQKLHMCGSNAFGQLGIPLERAMLVEPEESPVSDVVDIACGLRHSVMLKSDGSVWSCGTGKKGQLGISCSKLPSKQPVIQKVLLPVGCGKGISVVAGAYHSGVLTDLGQVFVWGCNKHGQGAQSCDDAAKFDTPVEVKADEFSKTKIVSLQSGWTHLLAVSEDGEVFSWGRADYGQLGREVMGRSDPGPRKIPDLKINQICCGAEHTLAVTENGHLVSWGWNEHGICATGDEKNVLKPQVLCAFNDVVVMTIGCGGGHSFAWCKKTT